MINVAAPFLSGVQIRSTLNNSCAPDTRPTWSKTRRTYSRPGILQPDPVPSAVSAIGVGCTSFRYRAAAMETNRRGWLNFGQCMKKTGVRVVCMKKVVSSAKPAAGIILMVRSLNRDCYRRQKSAETLPAPAAAVGNIKNAASTGKSRGTTLQGKGKSRSQRQGKTWRKQYGYG